MNLDAHKHDTDRQRLTRIGMDRRLHSALASQLRAAIFRFILKYLDT